MPLKPFSSSRSSFTLRSLTGGAVLLAAIGSSCAWAQNYPVTQGQRARANQVSEQGVPLSELAPNAPSSYKVKRGDTLWRISGLFLKSPWRWPDLWGMNIDDIKNPHRIYPGQELFLDTSNGRARLSTRRPGGIETIRVSPRTRSESFSDSAIPPVDMREIEAFLAEPLIVDADTYARAPRIVATPENRVLLSLGDRAYARSTYGNTTSADTTAPLSTQPGQARHYRVFRNAEALKDPATGEVLAYEAHYVGKAYLVRSEEMRVAEKPPAAPEKATQDVYAPQFNGTQSNVDRTQMASQGPAEPTDELVPATIDIVAAKEEIRIGDRLLPEPPREFPNYVPVAAPSDLKGQIVSIYGNALHHAAQNQVIAINRGAAQGVANGQVFALLRDADTVIDKTDDAKPTLRLPGERNGLMMVFSTFEKVSYALVLQITDGVKVGDHFVSP